ncbi:hypothetical protein [Burkholderia cepacia]|uniref:hypothetical protein n=1 Tax=Burkholderia cepacia TaxID=292 RepID=UPI000758EB12|nr:hypothetical protein [Burkholderia cepacia]KVB66122.1 hypothetical protein WI60_35005 [Burkholderia cepacia]KVB96533.1 hypothetical protein WI68_28060 [Burkholderia cepacia]
MKIIDSFLPPAVQAVVIGTLVTYALSQFDGVRKERRSSKSLVFICWYGARRLPVRLPRWITFVASVLRSRFRKPVDQIVLPTPSTQKVVVFIANNGRVPLSSEDLFKSTPLKLRLSGDGQLVDVRTRYESDQIAGIKLTGERSFLRRPKNHLIEREITFAYMAPGHGFALEIEYSTLGKTPVSFSLSGPVNGMKGSIQQQILFEIDIENNQRRRRERRSEILRLWIGVLMMVVAVIVGVVDAYANGGRFVMTKSLPYWSTLGLLAVGEIIALVAWFRVEQVRKIPAALRYWEAPQQPPGLSAILTTDRTTV